VMKQLIAFFRLIRISNILIMLITLVLSYYCLNDYLLAEDLFQPRFIILVIATLLTAAGGYIINDYYDVKLDLVNKPQKVIVGNTISRRWAILLHTSFNVLAVLLGLAVNLKVALAIIVCSALLYIYSIYFKKQFLSGNLLIAFLSGFMLILLWLFNKSTPVVLVSSYAVFAFMSTLLREIIKDTEDMKGDSRFNCRTLPIVIGVRKTKKVLQVINGLFILLLLIYIGMITENIAFRYSLTKSIYNYYLLLFTVVPAIGLSYSLYRADVKKDFSRLSSYVKLIMLAGILSMVMLKW
jgi:4-hydroxybenzoate polyprenyltransferase